MTPTIKIGNAFEIPSFGLGTWNLSGKLCQNSVLTALEIGYRHIDTAEIYRNHQDIAIAIQNSHIPRSQIFITTKVPASKLTAAEVAAAGRRYLDELRTDYIDLLLIHWPNDEIPINETLNAFEKLKTEKVIRHYGISNFNIDQTEAVLKYGFHPVNNQVRFHPTHQMPKLKKFCEDHQISITAYSPFAQGRDIRLKAIKTISQKYHQTPAQIIVSWTLALGLISIPKATSRTHLQENLNATSLKLSPEDLAIINRLD